MWEYNSWNKIQNKIDSTCIQLHTTYHKFCRGNQEWYPQQRGTIVKKSDLFSTSLFLEECFHLNVLIWKLLFWSFWGRQSSHKSQIGATPSGPWEDSNHKRIIILEHHTNLINRVERQFIPTNDNLTTPNENHIRHMKYKVNENYLQRNTAQTTKKEHWIENFVIKTQTKLTQKNKTHLQQHDLLWLFLRTIISFGCSKIKCVCDRHINVHMYLCIGVCIV